MSRGYVVWTNEDYLIRGLPADYLRLLSPLINQPYQEMNFSWQLFQERINNE
jgi:methionyl-tRNA synthetase